MSLLDELFPSGGPRRQPTPSNRGHDRLVRWEDGRLPAPEDELSTRHRMILTLEMQGHTQREIAEMLGYSSWQSVCQVVNTDRYKAYRDAYLTQFDDDFFAMKPLALDALRKGLRSADDNVALRASQQWFQGASFGGFAKTPVAPETTSAEDIARALVREANLSVNVQINNVVAQPSARDESE